MAFLNKWLRKSDSKATESDSNGVSMNLLLSRMERAKDIAARDADDRRALENSLHMLAQTGISC